MPGKGTKPTASGEWVMTGHYEHTAGMPVADSEVRWVMTPSQLKIPANIGFLIRGLLFERLEKLGYRIPRGKK